MALPGEALPVEHVRLNFGAEGERRDHEGNLWIRPGRKPHGLFTHVEFLYSPKWTRYAKVNEFQSFVRRSNVHTKIDNTDLDFVFTSGERGIQQCVIPIARPEDPKATYTIRLGFCALPSDRPGQRVFDIKINGKTVEEKFDALKVASKPDRAVWRDFTFAGKEEVVIEFLSAGTNPTLDQVPILNAIEVIRRDSTQDK